MTRLDGEYRCTPGTNTTLSEDGISSEQDWHKAFRSRMEASGWYVKHEVTQNNGDERVDFLAYHDELNTSYTDGEWIGFELKYNDYEQRTKAGTAAAQIEQKYQDKSWLSSGEDVALWVVAPYVEESHTGKPREMTVARSRESEAMDILSKLGYGYLNSWHPTPYISFEGRSTRPFPEFEYVSTPDIPAFIGAFDPWRHGHTHEFEAQEQADMNRADQKISGAFSTDYDARTSVWEKYRNQPPAED